MPRGLKKCPDCKTFVGARTPECSCGHIFKKKPKKQPKPFFKERKEFVKRMLGGKKPIDHRLDMMVVTKIFAAFENDLDFLGKVKPPFELNGSIKYFLTKDGKEYLLKKYREFNYKVPEADKYVDTKEKVGEDTHEVKSNTLRGFLYE